MTKTVATALINAILTSLKAGSKHLNDIYADSPTESPIHIVFALQELEDRGMVVCEEGSKRHTYRLA